MHLQNQGFEETMASPNSVYQESRQLFQQRDCEHSWRCSVDVAHNKAAAAILVVQVHRLDSSASVFACAYKLLSVRVVLGLGAKDVGVLF